MLIKSIADTTELPALNFTVTKLIQMLRREDASHEEVVATVERDQALVAQVLRVINSGYYGLKAKVESVGHAISLLGLMQLKSIVFGISVMGVFGEDQKAEWEHSYTSSLLMERLLKECGIRSSVSKDLPVGMLLHDLGKLILRKFSPKKYEMAIQACKTARVDISSAETNFLHVNHAEAAGILLDKWEIEPSISIPIQWHHTYDQLPPEEYTLESALVQFVDWVDHRVRDIVIQEPSPRLLRNAGIEEIDKLYWVSTHRKMVANLEEKK
jgi:HD-like signal output (HDOD) protein